MIGDVRVEHPTSVLGELGERSLDPPDANRAAMDQNGKLEGWKAGRPLSLNGLLLRNANSNGLEAP